MLTIDDLKADRPEYDPTAAKYRELESRISSAKDTAAATATVQDWDKLRRELETWSALVYLRFNQDTGNAEFKKEREYCDELTPRLTDLDVRIKRLLLASPHRPALEKKFGKQAFALWDADVMAFDPKIEQHLVRENKLQAEYSELTAAAQVEFRGQKYNLSGIVKFR